MRPSVTQKGSHSPYPTNYITWGNHSPEFCDYHFHFLAFFTHMHTYTQKRRVYILNSIHVKFHCIQTSETSFWWWILHVMLMHVAVNSLYSWLYTEMHLDLYSAIHWINFTSVTLAVFIPVRNKRIAQDKVKFSLITHHSVLCVWKG